MTATFVIRPITACFITLNALLFIVMIFCAARLPYMNELSQLALFYFHHMLSLFWLTCLTLYPGWPMYSTNPLKSLEFWGSIFSVFSGIGDVCAWSRFSSPWWRCMLNVGILSREEYTLCHDHFPTFTVVWFMSTTMVTAWLAMVGSFVLFTMEIYGYEYWIVPMDIWNNVKRVIFAFFRGETPRDSPPCKKDI